MNDEDIKARAMAVAIIELLRKESGPMMACVLANVVGNMICCGFEDLDSMKIAESEMSKAIRRVIEDAHRASILRECEVIKNESQ